MKPSIKLLTLSCVGLSAAVVAIAYRYISSQSNTDKSLSEFSAEPSQESPDKKVSSYDSAASPSDAPSTPPITSTTATTTPTTTTTTTDNVNNNNNNNNNNNIDVIGDIEDLNKKCGFCRPEMTDADRKSPANSIHEYSRHYFICSGIAADKWPSKWFESSEQLMTLADPIKKHSRTQLEPSIFNGIDMESTSQNTDFLLFPEMVKLVDVDAPQLESLLDYFSKNKSITDNDDSFPSHIKIENITGKYIFVCAHKLKDERCGYCGPILVDQLKEEIERRGLSNEIKVYASTHVGGHKYAGNVLVFPAGHWYGYAQPSDINEIIDSTINGNVITRLHRGTMGQPVLKEEKEKKQKGDHHKKH
ncbi:sucraseferredoxin-like family protein [Heterostelium album PN500]|uniref:Sucraseferredoxin-like family protein n=1 Tax=Heterostelium pallidum (strain ATCC 26659 / Pp 5 / PN500) TaxID=670386 RepID=D3BDY7_HETP5|nr:sucraseferredoxin-like family protein [Heterostelium album PN500]EFA80118.1 sucraseferredoxin-like family protein [Heterostelium album PN500]|eukprot:XP_020432238.1 sucraseferredoxin-like family protein [Heterostelium album PN500]